MGFLGMKSSAKRRPQFVQDQRAKMHHVDIPTFREPLYLGFNLNDRPSIDQQLFCDYIADQLEQYFRCKWDGRLLSVSFLNGFMQISMRCYNPEKVLMDYLSKLSSGEIDVMDVNGYGAMGVGIPLRVMRRMTDDTYGKSNSGDDDVKFAKIVYPSPGSAPRFSGTALPKLSLVSSQNS
jgi:hypothetical protein